MNGLTIKKTIEKINKIIELCRYSINDSSEKNIFELIAIVSGTNCFTNRKQFENCGFYIAKETENIIPIYSQEKYKESDLVFEMHVSFQESDYYVNQIVLVATEIENMTFTEYFNIRKIATETENMTFAECKENMTLAERKTKEGETYMKGKKKYIAIVVVAFIAVVMLFNVIAVVPAGHTGVVTTFGKVEEMILSEGLHLKTPVQTVININNQTLKVGAEGGAASKDLQSVSYTVEVNYKVNNDASAKLYRNVGISYETTIIQPAIQESVKAVAAKFTAEELITKRASVGDDIKLTLQNKISPYGINVEVFNIINFDFTDEFNKAVEAKQTAQQNALKAKQDLERIEVEAQQKVTQAKAEADSITLIQETLKTSPEYIEYIKWGKWDGKLPSVLTGNGDMILDIGKPDTSQPSEPQQ